MSGADIGAVTALDALGIVDGGQVVRDLDGLGRALALALHAAYAARIALLHHDGALLLGGAGGNDLLVVGHLLDDVLGADGGSGHAALALFPVHLRHAVFHAHGAEGAGPHAVAHAHAGELAQLGALVAEAHGGRLDARAGDAGRGLKFTLSLPRYTPPNPEAVPHHDPA